MSTDGSASTSGSGVRQFGLYRTIDARTEEFLRLSRRRQIRQGCACAAISTAITVTVVITMILIYEYSITHESSPKPSLKQNWLSLMNKSAEAIPFEAKLNKAKINLDPLYVHFLPLILKTLKKNKYYDNIIDDDSTQAPSTNKGEMPEDFTKDIFSDSSKWMRMPTSRLYTIEYKSSPIVYSKYPTRNIEQFTKIRRIRDYQRIMNYVDKMISDKVAFTSTVPMLKNTFSIHKKTQVTYPSTTPMPKRMDTVTLKQTANMDLKKKIRNNTSTTTKNGSCCCPKRINQLLSKLVKCLQKVIPDYTENGQMSSDQEKVVKTNQSLTKELEIIGSTQQSEETLKNDLTDAISDSVIITDFTNKNLKNIKSGINIPLTGTIMPNTISKTFYSVKPYYPKIDYTLSSIINLIKPQLIHGEIQQNNKEKLYTITTKQFIEGTDANYYIPRGTTKPMSKRTSTYAISYTSKSEEDIMLQNSKMNVTAKSLSSLPTSNTEYTDYYSTPDMVENLKISDVHSLEKAKTTMLTTNDKEKETTIDFYLEKAITQHPNLESINFKKQEYNDTWKSFKKTDKLAYFLSTTKQNISYVSIKKSNDTKSVTAMVKKENADFNSRPALSNTSKELNLNLNENKQDEHLKSEDVTLEEETDNASIEETTVEDNLKNLENLLNKINVSSIFNSPFKRRTEDRRAMLNKYGNIRKHTDSIRCQHSKSMLPEYRPSYLEIQRNDWKRDEEHQDYDNNLNNNYFP